MLQKFLVQINTAFEHFIELKKKKLQYITVYCISDQIKTALVSRRDFQFQKH